MELLEIKEESTGLGREKMKAEMFEIKQKSSFKKLLEEHLNSFKTSCPWGKAESVSGVRKVTLGYPKKR